MTYSFDPAARAELKEAIGYYDDRCPGLGEDFAAEVDAALRGVAEFPEAWPEVRPGIRRCLVHRFPYAVLYAVRADSLSVLVLMHVHRRPDYWVESLEGPPEP
ncbi:MAG: type II toxin-antitoxin system RelE/ParE family toxin [Armatimonadetes bacterium]|nr:type II toxin-antitoxin system RelE/ParE family toxin [Armatimonadota bacterium]